MAVGVGKQIVSVDVFDKPETCRRVWNRLLTGVIMMLWNLDRPQTGLVLLTRTLH